jgi:cell volume regulation protein A
MAVFLVLGLTALALDPGLSPWETLPLFFRQMLLGVLLGYLLGQGMAWSLDRLRLPFEGLYAVVSVAHVGLIYGLTALLGGSGFLAVYVAGLRLGSRPLARKRALRGFHEGLTYLLEVGMFLLLGLLVFPSQLPQVATPALLLALFLMFLARPAAVYLSLAFSPMPFNQKTLVAWVGLRGAVPIILATFPLLAGVPGAQTIFNVAFFVVLVNVLVQGASLPWVARVLRVGSVPEPESLES